MPGQEGQHNVSIKVTDLAGLQAVQNYVLTIDAAITAPQFISSPIRRAAPSSLYRYQPDYRSEPTSSLSFDIFMGPEGLDIDSATGEVTWQVPADAPESHFVVLRIQDEAGNYHLHPYRLTIAQPQITTSPGLHAWQGHGAYSYQPGINRIDDLEPFDWLLAFGPAGMTVNEITGRVDWPASQITSQKPAPLVQSNPMCLLSENPSMTGFATRTRWVQSDPYGVTQPLVGPLADTNLDGVLDVSDRVSTVFVSQGDTQVQSPAVNAVDARTGALLWTYRERQPDWQILPAMADLATTGEVSILYVDTEHHMVALRHDGRVSWVSDVPVASSSQTAAYNAISIADLDGDGLAEIMIGPSVFSHAGELMWQFPGGTSAQGQSLAVDLDGDGRMEVLYRDEVRDASGALLFKVPGSAAVAVNHAFFAPARLAARDRPDIVISQSTSSGYRLLAMTAQGELLWQQGGPTVLYAGPPLTGDFNGDGQEQVFLPASGQMFDASGELMRDIGAQPSWERRQFRSAIAADLYGDGHLEILAFGDRQLQVRSGETGALLSVPTGWHDGNAWSMTPVIVDAFGTGDAVIVVGGSGGARLYEPLNGKWHADTRVANQAAYAADRVRDDLTIPASQPHTTPSPLYRYAERTTNTPTTVLLSDLRPGAPYGRSESGAMQLSADITNRGMKMSLPFHVAFYAGDPAFGGALLGEQESGGVEAGETVTLSLAGLDMNQVRGDEIHVVVRAHSDEQECEIRNNTASGRFVEISATETGGLQASQAWVVGISEWPRAPGIVSTASTAGVEGEPYSYQILAESTHVGDAILYTLNSGPSGATVDPRTGLVQWTPPWGQTGQFTFSVRAASLGGYFASQTWSLAVEPSPVVNNPPVILSHPVSEAIAGDVYRYPVQAEDPDEHQLIFTLGASPQGMTIDRDTGLVLWEPGEQPAGPVEVVVIVTDERGATDSQHFEIAVASIVNQPPVITSSPDTLAVAGEVWMYTVVAEDPNGDPLTLDWLMLPPGVILTDDGATLTWEPESHQSGMHQFLLEVRDDRGGWARQQFEVHVTDFSGDQVPVILGIPPRDAKLGYEYRYAVDAIDPDGDTLYYSLTQAPVGASVDSNGLIRWTPDTTDSASLILRVSDGQLWVEQAWTVTVSEDQPLALSFDINPQPGEIGEPVSIQLQPAFAAGALSASLTLNGQPLVLDNQLTASYTADSAGAYNLLATVDDDYDSVSAEATLIIRDPDAAGAPALTLHTPADAAEITAPAAVRATITTGDNNLVGWRLRYRNVETPANAPGTLIAEGSHEVTDDVLGQFDPTLLINGQYHLILDAWDSNGVLTRAQHTVQVNGDMKIGHFSLTFEDATIPLAGMPITLTRTYDSRQRDQRMDFGHGWSVGYRNARVQESRVPGLGWALNQYGSGLNVSYCIEPFGDPIVTVTLPDGQLERFRARAFPECTALVPQPDVELRFEPLPGTYSTLEQLDFSSVRINDTDLLLMDLGSPGDGAVDPDRYRLTLQDGTQLTLDQGFGIRQARELSGNTLTFADSGITHSSGVGIQFVRDSHHRIEQVILPDGSDLHYHYDASSDLVSVTDQGGDTTTVTYHNQVPHLLEVSVHSTT